MDKQTDQEPDERQNQTSAGRNSLDSSVHGGSTSLTTVSSCTVSMPTPSSRPTIPAEAIPKASRAEKVEITQFSLMASPGKTLDNPHRIILFDVDILSITLKEDVPHTTWKYSRNMTPRAVKSFLTWIRPVLSQISPDTFILPTEYTENGFSTKEFNSGRLRQCIRRCGVEPSHVEEESGSVRELHIPFYKNGIWFLIVVDMEERVVELTLFTPIHSKKTRKKVVADVKHWFKYSWKRLLNTKPKIKKLWKFEERDAEFFGRHEDESGVLMCLELYRATRGDVVQMNAGDMDEWRSFVASKTLWGADELMKAKD
ncbi:unnamed protein product [Periconia digitata]|uniref:Uncharacterized protein n=1 Tax=Periconia digitata TaxID=1303443 RepID=A0A9W4U3I2_9PLEO|nr:unnamed protein product [Periconia digitata]